MDDATINRIITEKVMRGCWHDWPSVGLLACIKCGADWTYEQNSDYCSDLNAVAKAEAKVIEKYGTLLASIGLDRVVSEVLCRTAIVTADEVYATAHFACARHRAENVLKEFGLWEGA